MVGITTRLIMVEFVPDAMCRGKWVVEVEGTEREKRIVIKRLNRRRVGLGRRDRRSDPPLACVRVYRPTKKQISLLIGR